MRFVERVLHAAERDSLISVLRDMEEQGYSVEAQRRVLDAGLKHLSRFDPPLFSEE